MEIEAIQDRIYRLVGHKSPVGPDISIQRDEFEVQTGSAYIHASRTAVMVSHCTGEPSTVEGTGLQSHHSHTDGKTQSGDPITTVFAKSDRPWFTLKIDVCPTIDIFV